MPHKGIAEDLTIPKGSLTKLLANLVESRYLSFDPVSKTYKLGSRVLALANSYLSGLDIVQAAQPIVRRLVAKTDESAGLQVLEGNSAVVVHRQYASLTVMYLNIRTPAIDFPALEDALREAADELSACLGFQRGGFKRALGAGFS